MPTGSFQLQIDLRAIDAVHREVAARRARSASPSGPSAERNSQLRLVLEQISRYKAASIPRSDPKHAKAIAERDALQAGTKRSIGRPRSGATASTVVEEILAERFGITELLPVPSSSVDEQRYGPEAGAKKAAKRGAAKIRAIGGFYEGVSAVMHPRGKR